MKRIISIVNLLTAVFTMSLFVSCSSDDQVFEEQGHLRLSKQIDKIVTDLESAENGWVMRYYPSPQFVGGFVFLLDFEGGKVTLQSDFQNAPEESIYKVYGGEGPVLSFSEYSALHILSDPTYPPFGTGFRGDFEFVVMESSQDSIVLKGRKWNQKVTLYPASQMDWEDLAQLRSNEEILAPVGENVPFYRNLYVDGNPLATFLYKSNTRFLEYYYINGQGELKSGATGVSFTQDGFLLQKPVEINGTTLTEFKINETGDGFVFGENGTLQVENNSPLSYGDSWNKMFDSQYVALRQMSPDFYRLYTGAKEVEPDFQTMVFFWQLGQNYIKAFSFIFDDYAPQNRSVRYYHTSIGAVRNPEEDQAQYVPVTDVMGNYIYYVGGSATFDELNRLFLQKTEDSANFRAITDLVFDQDGFTIIPTAEGDFYMINNKFSNFWMLVTPY